MARASSRQDTLRRAGFALSFCACVLGHCGCTTGISEYVHNGFKVGPNYHRPPVPLTEQWIDESSPQVHIGDPNLATWWEVFDDPILNGLIQRSFSRNLTLRAAGFQILAAKAQRAIALGELLPQSQTYALQYIHGEASRNGGAATAGGAAAGAALGPAAVLSPVMTSSAPIAGAGAGTTAGVAAPTSGGTVTTPTNPGIGSSIGGAGGGGGGSRFFDNWATSLNLSWELDFWGLFRRNLEAADASLDQSVDNFDEMMVLLFANVASTYVEIRTLQKRLDLARRNVAQQEPLVAQFEQRYRAGVANSFPGYFQLRSNLENTKALIPLLEISLRQVNNQLCVLLGLPVRDLLPELGDGTGPDPRDPSKRVFRIPAPRDEAVVVGIPGDLLLRRPDVQAAEQQLRIQSAQIGIAEAEMYPHIGVNGSIGLAANSFNKLFSPGSGTGTIGPSLTWNILNYGRLLANVRLQNRNYQQSVATYQNTILNANQDAENALVGYLQSLEQSRHLQASADSAAQLTGYLIRQFKQGYLPPGAADTSAFINQLFTASNFQVTQQDAAAQAEGNIALNLILLYRALGGGWQIRPPDMLHFCPDTSPDDLTLPVTAPQGAVPGAPPSTPMETLPEPKPAPVMPPMPAK
jgi:NodT family efflux transporter outer membrane factor (OMF) lipoprotein